MLKESIKNLVLAIAEGDSVSIEDSFNSVMASKISDRLDDLRVDVAQSMFGSVVEESYELDEAVVLDEEETPTGIKIYHTDKAGKSGSQIVFTHQDAARAHKEIKKEGGKVTHHALMFGKTEGEKRVVSESVDLDEEFDFLDEAVGTAAKYAGKTGMMGGKYKSTDKALELVGDKFNSWRDKQSAKKSTEHEKQDPKMSKMGYAKHMVDIEKAKKNADARGVDASHLNWKHRNGVQDNRRLPEEFYLEDYSVEELEDFMVSEDFEQLDELSKKTLGSYIMKAQNHRTRIAATNQDIEHHNNNLNRASQGASDALRSSLNKAKDDLDTDRRKNFKTDNKRFTGISRAVGKLTKEAYERGDMGTDNSPKGSARGSSLHSMDIAKKSGYTHAVMHMGAKGGIDSYHTTKAGADKKLASLRKKHNIPENSPRARIAEL